jgi:hypothetical protein
VIVATLIDWAALGKVVLYSMVAAVTVTAVFSFGIVGVVRYDDRRRTGSGGLPYLALALLSALLVTAAVVAAIIVMAKK